MPAGTYNLLIEQGASFNLLVSLSAFDLSDYSARSSMRKTYNSEAKDFTTTVTPSASSILISLTPTETALLDYTAGVWDLEIENNNSDVFRVLQGTVEISREVTK